MSLFILSGFVLVYRHADLQTFFIDYLLNRFTRIYPIYLVVAFATIPWIGISFLGSLFEILKGCWQADPFSILKYFLYRHGSRSFFGMKREVGQYLHRRFATSCCTF